MMKVLTWQLFWEKLQNDKKIWRATNMHVYFLLGLTLQRTLIIAPSTFKKEPK